MVWISYAIWCRCHLLELCEVISTYSVIIDPIIYGETTNKSTRCIKLCGLDSTYFPSSLIWLDPGTHFNIKTIFPNIAILIIKVKQSWDRYSGNFSPSNGQYLYVQATSYCLCRCVSLIYLLELALLHCCGRSCWWCQRKKITIYGTNQRIHDQL